MACTKEDTIGYFLASVHNLAPTQTFCASFSYMFENYVKYAGWPGLNHQVFVWDTAMPF